ncbi:MAG: 50S ribosomal protein L19, partial [bacterium]|nr:50S ribosomal protein L19 [bacterium]
MSILQEVQKLAIKKKVPVLRTGYTVRVHQKIKEGEKQRIQIFEGLVIKMNSGYGADKTFTVRKIVQGIGVEKIFSLYSPLIEKIEVKKIAKVRRAKLFYMRKRSGKSARLKEGFVNIAEAEQSEA